MKLKVVTKVKYKIIKTTDI